MTLITLNLAFQQQLKEMASNARYVGMEYHDHILLHFAFLMMSRSLTHFLESKKQNNFVKNSKAPNIFQGRPHSWILNDIISVIAPCRFPTPSSVNHGVAMA